MQSRAEIEFATGATGYDAIDAAQLLERALLQVVKADNTPNFELAVGFEGRDRGVVSVQVSVDQGVADSGVRRRRATDRPRRVRGDPATAFSAFLDHVSVFYGSGHAVVSGGAITKPVIRPVAFNGWQWWPCGGCEVTMEKPVGTPGEMGRGDSPAG